MTDQDPGSSESLGGHLASTVDEGRLQRVWDGVTVKRHGTPGRTAPRMVALAAGLATVAALLAVVGPFSRDWADGPGGAPGALRGVDGEPAPGRVADGEMVRFEDGSRVTVIGGDLVLAHASGEQVFWLLESGVARFEVTPGGPRRWSVDAGDVRVDVLGTVFSVERDPRSVAVEVQRGVVSVSARPWATSRRVAAGERVVVDTSGSAAVGDGDAAPGPTPDGSAAARGDSPDHDLDRGEPAAPGERSTGPPSGNQGAAAAAEGSKVVPSPDLGAALEAADRARQGGQHEAAARLLETALRAPDDRRLVGVAELTLGRLLLRHLDRPRDAARHFERALAHAWPPATRSTLHALRLEASVAAGDPRGASRAAEAWVSDEPEAASRPEVARWR